MKGHRVTGLFNPEKPLQGTITQHDENNGECVITWDPEPGYRPQMGFFQVEHIGRTKTSGEVVYLTGEVVSC
jgi:hypothetical protein